MLHVRAIIFTRHNMCSGATASTLTRRPSETQQAFSSKLFRRNCLCICVVCARGRELVALEWGRSTKHAGSRLGLLCPLRALHSLCGVHHCLPLA